MKARPPIHAKTHSPLGTDPLPDYPEGSLADGWYGAPSNVPANTTVTVDSWGSGQGFDYADDPNPDSNGYLRIVRPGLYLVLAEAWSYPATEGRAEPILQWFDDGGTGYSIHEQIVGWMSNRPTNPGAGNLGHRFSSWALLDVAAVPNPATHGRLRLDFFNADTSDRQVGNCVLWALAIDARNLSGSQGWSWFEY